MNNKQAIEVGEELLEHSKKDIPYHKRKEGVTEALSHFIDLAKAYESASKELPEKAEHSKDCLYVIAPHYVGNKSKEKYCTCGAFDNNYALDQAQLTVTKLKMEIEELNEEIDKQIDKYTWLEGDKYQLQQQLAESRELQNKIIEGGKEITKLIRENEELREKVRELSQGICEHVKSDELVEGCKLCEMALATKTYVIWVEKAKKLQQRIATLESRVGEGELRKVIIKHFNCDDPIHVTPEDIKEFDIALKAEKVANYYMTFGLAKAISTMVLGEGE